MPPAPAEDFEVLAQLDIGLNPHQISCSEDGRTARAATAGEDVVTAIDAVTREVVGTGLGLYAAQRFTRRYLP